MSFQTYHSFAMAAANNVSKLLLVVSEIEHSFSVDEKVKELNCYGVFYN